MWENKSQTRPPVTTKSGNGEEKNVWVGASFHGNCFVQQNVCSPFFLLHSLGFDPYVSHSKGPRIFGAQNGQHRNGGLLRDRAIRVRHGTTTHPVPGPGAPENLRLRDKAQGVGVLGVICCDDFIWMPWIRRMLLCYNDDLRNLCLSLKNAPVPSIKAGTQRQGILVASQGP